MQVSVIIAVYNRASLLPDLLEQWRKIDEVTKYKYELIFSDDESSDNSVSILENFEDLPIKVLSNKHGGASKARNHAYQHATGEIVIFTGDDIFPTLNFVNEHYETYLKNGSMYATLGCIDWREGIRMNHLMKHITDIGCEQFGFVGMRPFEIVDFRHFYTSNISVAREQLEQLDCLFDPAFKKYGFEDIDLGYRLHKRGIEIFYNPNALAYHDHVYDSVEKFCKRQQSAGEELNTFKQLHPELNTEEIKFNINEFHEKYYNYMNSNKVIDFVGDTGRLLIYLMMQFTKLFELILRKRQFNLLKKICSKFYSIIFSYYMYLGLAYGYNNYEFGPKYKAQRFTFRYLFFGKAQVFYDKSNHFSELNAVTFHTVGEKNIILKLDIPEENVGRIRLDPLDNICKTKIDYAIAYLNNGTKEKISFNYTNANNYKKGIYYFHRQFDPVIISDVLPANTKSVEISYKINYLLSKRILKRGYHLLGFTKKIVKKVYSLLTEEKKNKLADSANINSAEMRRKIWITIKCSKDQNLSHMLNEYREVCSNLLDVHIDILNCLENQYIEFVYDLMDTSNRMEKNQFLNAVFCLSQYNCDFVIVSDSLEYFPVMHGFSVQDSILLSRHLTPYDAFSKNNGGAIGKFIRLPGSKRIENEINLTLEIPNLKMLDNNTLFINKPHELFWNNQLKVQQKSKEKLTVFVFTVFMAVGGVERNTIEIMERLKGSYNFVVITFEAHRPEQGSLFYQIAQMGLDYYDFAEMATFDKYNYLLENLKLVYDPDLVWICNSSPWTMENASELRKIFYNIPIIVQDVYDYEYGWIEYYNRPVIHSYDRFIAINKRIEEKFIHTYGINAEDIDLVYSATDTEKITLTTESYSRADILNQFDLDPQRMYFAFVGRFTEQKQPLKLLELAKYIVDSHHNIDFIMVGDGELSSKVEKLIESYNLQSRIHRIKYISNVSQFIKAIDGLFIASIYEGLPIVTIEAMCVGTPIFSTDVGDVSIFVEKNNIGIISKQHDLNTLKQTFDIFYSNLHLYKQNSLDCISENVDFFSSKRAASLMNQSFQKAIGKYHSESGEEKERVML
ncbi:glycosyltransferase [Paenibacillus sp. TY11]|uniref:glycosyltransferase n=1 Tax=Paenibacillus sp. TY11 TaxID=3448633 RepID=UPI00403A3470